MLCQERANGAEKLGHWGGGGIVLHGVVAGLMVETPEDYRAHHTTH